MPFALLRRFGPLALVTAFACGPARVDELTSPDGVRLVTLGFDDHSLTVPAAVENGELVSGGDIHLGSAAQVPVQMGDLGTTQNALSVPHNVTLWPDGVVYYSVSSSHPYLGLIRNGIAAWERGTRVRFVPRTNQANYVNIIDDPGKCYSNLGMTGGAQTLSIGGNCSAAHELGHALGALHEHQRADRDEHINIFWANIPAGYWTTQFTKYTSSYSSEITPYDVNSVMHYASYESISSGRLLDLKNGSNVPYHWYPDDRDNAAIDRLYQTQMATANASVVLNAQGGPLIVTRGPQGRYWLREKSSPTGSWSAWEQISDTTFDSKPAVVFDADGILHVFGRSGLSAYELTKKHANGNWIQNTIFGFVQGHMSAALNQNGVVEVFGRDTNNALEHARRSASGSWSGWSSLGGLITGSPSVFQDADGRLIVFVVGLQRGLWSIKQTTPGGSFPSTMQSHGGAWASEMSGTLNGSHELVVSGRGVERGVWRLHESPANGPFTSPTRMGGVAGSAPLPLLGQSGEMSMFYVGTDRALYHARQTTPGGEYSGFASLHGDWAEGIAGITDGAGIPNVFLTGTNGHLYTAVAPDYTPQDLGGDWTTL